jgi:hypothetical protein
MYDVQHKMIKNLELNFLIELFDNLLQKENKFYLIVNYFLKISIMNLK